MSQSICTARSLAVCFSLLLAGSAVCQNQKGTPSPQTQPIHISGQTMGGRQPLVGGKIYLYAAGTTGTGNSAYGANATSLLKSPGYVVTDSNGRFDITGDYTCAPGALVYAIAIGGAADGKGDQNSAIAIFDAIGDCGQLSPSSFIAINEVSTVAHTAALQQFMTVKANGIPIIGAPSTNVTGLKNAFLNATNIVPFSNGAVAPDSATQSLPRAEINTLADILANCVNSKGPNSDPCADLFAAVVNPVDAIKTTTAAMLSIAKHPYRAEPVYDLLPPGPGIFTPTLASAPNDWTVGVTYTGGSMYSPRYLAIDATGNAFVFDCQISCSSTTGPMSTAPDKLVEFGPSGAVVNTVAGPEVHNVFGLAIDTTGTVYTANDGKTASGMGNTTDSIGVIPSTASGNPPSFFTSPNLASPYQIVLDASSNFYLTNQASSFIDYVVPSKQFVDKASQPGDLAQPTGIALEPLPFPFVTGVLFAGDSGNNSIQTFLGLTNFNNTPGDLFGIQHFNYGDVKDPQGVAVGSNNYVWYVNTGGDTVAVLSPFGQRVGPITTSGFGLINEVAVDGDGHAWVPSCNFNCSQPGGNQNPDSVNEINLNYQNRSLNLISPKVGYENPNFNIPAGLALDASGNVWVTNAGHGSVTVLLGAAGPVQTPLQAAFINNNIGQRP